jgi:thioredoxin 1
MPKYDTPITVTSAEAFERILKAGAGLPVLLLLHTADTPGAPIETALRTTAKNEAGQLLVAKASSADSPDLAKRYSANGGSLLIGLQNGAEGARRQNPTPSDVEAFAAYLLGRGELPKEEPKPAASSTSSGKPVHVTDSSFSEMVLNSSQAVLVDFWAEWCGPCRMIAPSLEKLAREFAGQATIAKLNVDENRRMAATYQARSIPMLLIFKDGKVADRLVGAAPESMLRQFIQKNL